MFIGELHTAVRSPEDRYDEWIRDTAQTALAEVTQTERAKRETARRASSLVYFVERDGFVKIGHTSNLKRRLQQLGTGSSLIEGMTVGPVRVLATIDGAGPDNERWLHERFAHLRVGGEWFVMDDSMRDFMSGLKGCRSPVAA
ncbi:GIY-YIG nuclease family protein [Streptomyces sp. NPDC056682]|uniref:GIY-YIG nuclease family protein n=1 Tax=Streptomyces sp. NPDC056682 TaxID=3345909 RepID=UPI0036AA753F